MKRKWESYKKEMKKVKKEERQKGSKVEGLKRKVERRHVGMWVSLESGQCEATPSCTKLRKARECGGMRGPCLDAVDLMALCGVA